jgi:hypothetical protein
MTLATPFSRTQVQLGGHRAHSRESSSSFKLLRDTGYESDYRKFL